MSRASGERAQARAPLVVLFVSSLVALHFAFLTGAARATPSRAQAEASARRPDVLMIILDDLNAEVGCLDARARAWTPNIDALAERGVNFTNAHAPAPACNPSRAAVLTGLAPHRTGLYGQSPGFRSATPDALTLAQRLKGHGYRTLGAGKVFHKPFPDPVSWDEFFPSKDLQLAPDGARSVNQERLFGSFFCEAVAPEAELGEALVARWIAAQLLSPPEDPFFLVCGFHRPHVPWVAPAPFYERLPLAELELPAVTTDDRADLPPAALDLGRFRDLPDERQARLAVQAYRASVAYADSLVGEVLAALERSPRRDGTIVVLWSDNGFHLGQKGYWGKLTLWEESTHVPLIVCAPGVRAGTRCDRPVSLQDLYPTLLELCGLPAVEGLDGQSLVPLLEDPQQPWDRPALTTWGEKNHSLRSERWRYTRYQDGSEELYDHAADPHEWKNLAAVPELAQVKRALGAWLPAQDAPSRKGR